MLKGIIGIKPVVDRETLPHIAIIKGQKTPPSWMFEVSKRQKRVLRELDLNIDALNVFNLLSSFTPRPQKRKRGKWIDDRYTDGDWLDYDMLLAAEKAKEAAVDEANRLKAERAAARRAAKENKDKEKELRAKAKEERAKERVQKAKQKADVKAAEMQLKRNVPPRRY
ncbi:hypothetical protein GQ600_2624 [Phytophthora cactorum]|nr:hypothetical protein GQ600_2624 [Phytophthora cactorum]